MCGGADLRGCSKNSSEPVVGLHARCFQSRPSCGIHQQTASCMLNLHPLAPLPCGHTLKPPTEHLHSHGVRMLCYIMHVCSASSPLPLLHRSRGVVCWTLLVQVAVIRVSSLLLGAEQPNTAAASGGLFGRK